MQQAPVRSGVQTDDSIPVTLAATLADPSSLLIEIEAGLPTATVAEAQPSVTIDPGETAVSHTTTISWPVAGHHQFDTPTLTIENDFFRETLLIGTTPSVTVEPREPRAIHVGEGGDRLATAYGEHDGGRHGFGIEPAELREYIPGDTMDRIDWKATARLSSPHVREYEGETDRRTLLLIDQRCDLMTGEPGETKLEYLREVALAIMGSARRLGDPVGLLGVGDAGITTHIEPTTTPVMYTRIKHELLTLEPTTVEQETPTTKPHTPHLTLPETHSTDRRQSSVRNTTADARMKLEAITATGEEETFVSTLRPFYAARKSYQTRIESEPLYGAVRTAIQQHNSQQLTIICTDDSNPGELREAVTAARKNGNAVIVLLAPTVLYESGGLADIERAYDRYVEFESFRRDLAQLNRVTALEVGPKDRLSSVLSARRPRGKPA
ncbi:hypothetical protein C482_20231 [Natrialba chahannaoensis JCM 10990]|uniref:DUF58 domain-containing protein n=1 Tax=Natrialba chahannaoensis JCM 10990 TaxID=1227492 RepID=M0A387_9EURY|nr:hypothetical protein C482_20231 [Natrialba chahannaoensis JCM 10990]